MARRVVIDSSGSSPLLVSASGYDADTAGFENVIFNGNQQPLRLYSTNYIVCAPNNTSGSLPLPLVTPGPTVSAAASGLTSIYVLAVRRGLPGPAISGDLQTPFHGIAYPQTGVGGMISSNQLFGINFQEYYGSLTFGSAYLNYLVFRNSG